MCNGRPFKTYFGTSYLDDSFFYTHQYALTVNCSDISKLISTIHDLWYLEYSIFKVYIYIYIYIYI